MRSPKGLDAQETLGRLAAELAEPALVAYLEKQL